MFSTLRTRSSLPLLRAVQVAAVSVGAMLLSNAWAQVTPALQGTWQVQAVHINTESARTVHYGWDDPRFRHRLVTIDAKSIRTDIEEAGQTCKVAEVRPFKYPLAEGMRRSLGGYGLESRSNPVSDYRLPREAQKVSALLQPICGDGRPWQGDLGALYGSPDDGIDGAWMALVSPDQLLLRWRDETVLALARVAPGSAPVASFDCAKAQSATERAICADASLAGHDRSVADAFKLGLDQAVKSGEDAAGLRQAQRQWLSARNACGADTACLLRTMRERVNALSEAVP